MHEIDKPKHPLVVCALPENLIYDHIRAMITKTPIIKNSIFR